MFNTICRKSWVSPLTAFSFVAVGATGTLLLFGVHLPAIKGIHEWLGLLFVIAGLVHVILNWRTLLSYLTAPSALAALAVVVVLGILLSAIPGEGPEHRFGPGMGHREGAVYGTSAGPGLRAE
ncbi:MAG: DUF4405 domain-containing protein [Candidatus Hydrogenedentes bacterium]|nr:DUF4405 domain-containing protein [Candidatus Hydrogenedentota bacterium]